MSIPISLPEQPASVAVDWRKLFAGITTVAIVVYPILLAWFTAPSKFYPDNSYEAKLHGPLITSNALPLELPKDEAELTHTLRADDPVRKRHEAQLKLFRRAQAWDNVFIELYVLQYAAMALLVVATGPLRFIQALAIASIVVAGIFDWLENLRIQEILNRGGPPFGDLIARVTLVSTTKWIAIFVACLLLAPLLWRLPETRRKFRIALVAALIAASATGFVGVLPGLHSFLRLALGFYGVVPVLILWRVVFSPAVKVIDSKLQATAALSATEEEGRVARFNIDFRSAAPKWSLDQLESAAETPRKDSSTPQDAKNP